MMRRMVVCLSLSDVRESGQEEKKKKGKSKINQSRKWTLEQLSCSSSSRVRERDEHAERDTQHNTTAPRLRWGLANQRSEQPFFDFLFILVEGNVTMVGDASEPNIAYRVHRGQVTTDNMKPHVGGYACGMQRCYHDNLGAM